MPFECVATRWAARNQVRSGRCVRCMIVPAVTDVCRRRRRTPTSRPSSPASSPLGLAAGQTKPFGQRRLVSQSAQASSSGKSAMKCWSDGGRSCFQRET